MKPLVGDDHPSVFFPHEIEQEVSEQNPDVDYQQRRDWFHHIVKNQKSAENKGGILGKGKPDAPKDEKSEESQIRKMSDDRCHLRHTSIIAEGRNCFKRRVGDFSVYAENILSVMT